MTHASAAQHGVPSVTALFVYPLKSAAGIPVTSLALDMHGARGDRRWMVVDDTGYMLSQREAHGLALVTPKFLGEDRDGGVALHAAGRAPLLLDAARTSPVRTVRLWKDIARAHDAGSEAAAWMSDLLGRGCRVVRIADDSHRPLAQKNAGVLTSDDRTVAFPDAAPLLLLGAGSIRALNDRLLERGEDPVGVERFRPNVLFDGADAHAEDGWTLVQAGTATVAVGSPCARCVMTTIDQFTAMQGVEPLRTLSSYRRQREGVMFGMNCTNAAPGAIELGDEIRVLGNR